MSIINESEFQKKRTSHDLMTWCSQILEEIKQDNVEIHKYRLRDGLYKKFIEELLPLSIVANHLSRNNPYLIFQPLLGNQNYDAIVIASDEIPIYYLEFTLAINGEEDFFIRKLLNDYGSAPGCAEYKKYGTKNTGINIEYTYKAQRVDEYLFKQLALIKRQLEKKYKIHYNPATILVILFEDFIPLDPLDIIDAFKSHLNEHPVVGSNKFKKIILTTYSGRVLFEL